MKYTKKPGVVDAIQYGYELTDDVKAFVGEIDRWTSYSDAEKKQGSYSFFTPTRRRVYVKTGDYLVKDILGGVYGYTPEIFNAMYTTLNVD